MKMISFNVKEIHSSKGIYILGKAGEILDEGDFYRIDNSFIIDKYRIISTSLEENNLTIHMKDEDIILTVERK